MPMIDLKIVVPFDYAGTAIIVEILSERVTAAGGSCLLLAAVPLFPVRVDDVTEDLTEHGIGPYQAPDNVKSSTDGLFADRGSRRVNGRGKRQSVEQAG